jgi:3-methyladenine DNA glycosylase/8-oxoguanine DNA glycosylase
MSDGALPAPPPSETVVPAAGPAAAGPAAVVPVPPVPGAALVEGSLVEGPAPGVPLAEALRDAAGPGAPDPGVVLPGAPPTGPASLGVPVPGAALAGVEPPATAPPGIELPGTALPGTPLPGVEPPGTAPAEVELLGTPPSGAPPPLPPGPRTTAPPLSVRVVAVGPAPGDPAPVPRVSPARTPAAPADGLVREWRPDFPLDVRGVLAPLHRPPGDPTFRTTPAGVWRAGTTPDGPATTLVSRRPDGTVVARAWGPGAAWSLDGLPALLGAHDDPAGFVAHHPLVADVHRRRGGLRFGRAGRVWDQVLPAVLEQKVTGTEARRSHRELCRRFGDPAPGPLAGLRLPPTPQQVRAIPDWEWHRAGVDHKRKRAVLSAAVVAHRLERACELGGEAGRELLRTVPGIGVWTAAEVAQRAWGDPDAVSFGDLHVPRLVGWALVGRPLDDAGMMEVLAPYRPQRQRAVRYIEVSGFRRPRFAPRFSPRDYRAM